MGSFPASEMESVCSMKVNYELLALQKQQDCIVSTQTKSFLLNDSSLCC